MHTARIWYALAVLLLLVSPAAVARAQPSQSAISAQVVTPGVNYLMANYNTSVGLVRNSPDSLSLRNSYYLYSDNFLASLVFWNFDQNNITLARDAQNITKTMEGRLYGQPNPLNQYETLSSTVYSFYPSRDFTLYTRGQERILTTINNQSSTSLDPRQYADIGFLMAVYYHLLGNDSAARIAYYDAYGTWDGIGFKDAAFSGQYQTYKLALYIYASKLLGISYDKQAFNTLIDLQATSGIDNGGFYTCYDPSGRASCGSNAETTALAILALDLADPSNSPTSQAQEMILLIIIASAFSVGLLVVGLTLKHFR
jgi:hypothetical protein